MKFNSLPKAQEALSLIENFQEKAVKPITCEKCKSVMEVQIDESNFTVFFYCSNCSNISNWLPMIVFLYEDKK